MRRWRYRTRIYSFVFSSWIESEGWVLAKDKLEAWREAKAEAGMAEVMTVRVA